jgi:hypothetical protein
MQCCPNGPARQIPLDVHEYARDVTRRLMRTTAFLKSRDQRKRVEMRFAHLKIHHGFERMRLRGLSGARDEFLLAPTVQNLKTLALRLLGPPPARCARDKFQRSGPRGRGLQKPERGCSLRFLRRMFWEKIIFVS